MSRTAKRTKKKSKLQSVVSSAGKLASFGSRKSGRSRRMTELFVVRPGGASRSRPRGKKRRGLGLY
jgi:hypothetical protein